MLHVKDSMFQNFKFGAFTFLVFYSVIHSCRGESQVIGSSNPIVAQVGEGIILPCRLDPALNALDMTLEWVRPDLDPRFVFVWRDGVELKSKKHPSYQGRTSLFIDELEKGNISLKLSEVKISDEGKYRCFIPGLKKESYVQLVVGAVSSPVVTLEGIDKATSGVVLQCESGGWYPKPEVLWLDGEGKLLSAGPPETVTGPDDLYTVSSRVTVEKRHSNNFTCRVQQKDVNQTREAQIHVPDDFFPIPPGSSSSAPIVIGVVVGLMVILVAVFVVWKCIKNKIRNKKHHKDEESQNVTEKKKSSLISNNSEQEILMQREKERSETTDETDTEETGLLSQIDGITPQIESSNVLNETQANVENQPVNNGPEFRERQREQPTAGGDTNTGLVKGQENTETEAVDEGRDSLSQEEEKTEHDPNKREKETTAETETEETGLLSQIDEITPQIESSNVPIETQANVEHQPVNNGPELQSTLESKIQIDQALAGGDMNTVFEKNTDDTETAAVNEGREALSTAEEKTEHDLNSDGEHSKSGSENIEQLVVGRQIGNNMQTVETRLQSQIDGEIPQKEKSNVLNATQANVENQPVNNRPELRERQREQPTAGEETITGLVNRPEDSEAEAVDEESAALNGEEGRTEDLNNGGAESKSGSDSTEQPGGESQTKNYMHTESEESPTNVKTEDPSSKEKLTGMLKAKVREIKKSEEHISRFEGQVKDKEKQIHDLKLQLEAMETERKLQKDKMVPETQIVEADKKLLDIQKKLEKREKDLERIKKDLAIAKNRKTKASNEKEETIKKLYEMGENEKSLTLSQDEAGNQSDSDSL